MRKKIHKNLVGIAALAILLTIGLTFWAYFMMLQKQIFQDLQTDVHVLASSDYIVETLEQNYDANADGLRITLVDADGNVLYESKANASKMKNHMERWGMIADDIWDMILGKAGRLPGKLAPEIIEKAEREA